MKLHKRVSILALIAIITATNTFSVCADTLNVSDNMITENFSGPSGDSMGDIGRIPTKEEQINQAEMILNSRTASDTEKRLAEQAIMKLNLEEPLKPTLKPTVVYDKRSGESINVYVLGVPLHKQERSYYCGPATTLQTLEWHGSYGHTQTSLANALGTTSSGTDGLNIVDVLNANQSKVHYIVANLSTKEKMMISLISSTAGIRSPAVLRLKISRGGNWQYSSEGHFMNVSGVSDDYSTVYVTDPYIQWVDPSITGAYRVTGDEAYTSTKNHFARHFYW